MVQAGAGLAVVPVQPHVVVHLSQAQVAGGGVTPRDRHRSPATRYLLFLPVGLVVVVAAVSDAADDQDDDGDDDARGAAAEEQEEEAPCQTIEILEIVVDIFSTSKTNLSIQ